MLSLQCTVSRDLIGFIAIGLNKIKVHQPKILKDLIVKKLQDTLSIYEGDLEIKEEWGNEGY